MAATTTISFGRGVSLVSAGIIRIFFCRSRVSSRTCLGNHVKNYGTNKNSKSTSNFRRRPRQIGVCADLT
jgi:hypothetical protein